MKSIINLYIAFRDLTKDNFDYFINTLAVLAIIYKSSTWLIDHIKNNIYVNISIFVIVITLIIVLKNNIYQLNKSLSYKIKINKFKNDIVKQTVIIDNGLQKIDFDKLIPDKNILEYLTDESYQLAKKQLSSDVKLTNHRLWIDYINDSIDRPVEKIYVYLLLEYYSPNKHLIIKYQTIGLKPPTNEQRYLQYSENAPTINPIYSVPKWKEGIIAALEDSEADIIGRSKFNCTISPSISTVMDTLIIFITPDSPVNKSNYYSFRNGVLYKTNWRKNIQLRIVA